MDNVTTARKDAAPAVAPVAAAAGGAQPNAQPKPEIDGFHLVIEALKLNGIDTVFGCRHPDDRPHAHAAGRGPADDLVPPRAERGLRRLDRGFLTQKPGICLTVSAPGFLNGLTALAHATTNCFPMILISGSSEREIVDLQQGDYEEMDQLAIAKGVAKAAFRVLHAEDIGVGLARAIRAAVSGRPGGVYLDLPAKLFPQSIDAETGRNSLIKVVDPAPRQIPDRKKRGRPRSRGGGVDVSTPVVDISTFVDVPQDWPASLSPEVLSRIDLPTPFLAGDLRLFRDRLDASVTPSRGAAVLRGQVQLAPGVLRTVAADGRAASRSRPWASSRLCRHRRRPADVLYSNTVKPAVAHRGRRRGRASGDSPSTRRASCTRSPGTRPAARSTSASASTTAAASFRSRASSAPRRTRRAPCCSMARSLGLQPYGLTFHVGSQCTATSAWVQAIASVGRLMRQLPADGIRIEMLDIGGGFPARYGDPVPSIEQIGSVVERALDELLPYRAAAARRRARTPLVAETAVIVASVLGREERAGEEWLYLDVGAYNGLMETQQTVGQWRFPLWSSRPDHGRSRRCRTRSPGRPATARTPCSTARRCRSTMAEGDRVFVASAGAYTLSYASHFNGFPPPPSLPPEPSAVDAPEDRRGSSPHGRRAGRLRLPVVRVDPRPPRGQRDPRARAPAAGAPPCSSGRDVRTRGGWLSLGSMAAGCAQRWPSSRRSSASRLRPACSGRPHRAACRPASLA